MKSEFKDTFTSFYQNGDANVICSLKLSQRTGNTPIVEIDSPFSIVKPSIVKIYALSTSHNFVIHNVQNGTLVDFVNSIAKCIIQARLPCDIIVAAACEGSFMFYSPSNDRIEYFYSENLSDKTILGNLKKSCISTSQSFQNSI